MLDLMQLLIQLKNLEGRRFVNLIFVRRMLVYSVHHSTLLAMYFRWHCINRDVNGLGLC